MTDYQQSRCKSIISSAAHSALAAGAVSEIAVKAVQITMVLELADVFGVSMSKTVAASIVNYSLSGSIMMEAARWLLPPSRILTAIKASEQTEDLGWRVAKDFDKK